MSMGYKLKKLRIPREHTQREYEWKMNWRVE